MKFNIKFKYILFIILSFVFVMSDVGATNVNVKDIGSIQDTRALFKVYKKGGDVYKRNGEEVKFYGQYVINSQTGQSDLICLDPCGRMANKYSNVSSLSGNYGSMISSLLNDATLPIMRKLAVGQVITGEYDNNTCKIYNNVYPFKINQLFKDFANYCNIPSQYNLYNNDYYLEYIGGGTNNDVCNAYRDVKRNSTKVSNQITLSKPKITTTEVNDDGINSVVYNIEFKINNFESYISSAPQTYSELAGKASVTSGKNSWYSITNSSNYKIESANLSGTSLIVKIKQTGECSPVTLKIDDHGTSPFGTAFIGKGYGLQTIAMKSSIFNTSVGLPCEKETKSGRCSIVTYSDSTLCKPVERTYVSKITGGSFTYHTTTCDSVTNTQLKFGNQFMSKHLALTMGYSSYSAFMLSKSGADCCDDYKNDISFRNSLWAMGENPTEYEQAYNTYCLNSSQSCSFDGTGVYNTAFPQKYVASHSLMAKYAFEGLGCCDDYKNDRNGFGSLKTNVDWQNAYITYCGGPKTEITTSTACINPAPNSQTKVDNKINNCCLDDTHSYVQEVQLNDLFDNTKIHEGVTYFEPLPTCEGSDLDVAKGQINNYCDYYCTERLDIEVPGSTSADSGRYFKFNEIDGHASPKIDGYRRCRVTIKYDQWYSEYKQKLNELVTLFNDWQQKKAMLKMYQDARNTRVAKTRSYTITCEKCTTPSRSSCDSRCNSYLGYGHDQCISACMTPSCDTTSVGATEDYYEYNYPNVYYGKESISSSTANVNFGYSFTPSADHVSKGTDNHDSVTHDPSCPSGYHKIGSSAANYSVFSFDGTDSAESQARQAYQTKLQEIQTLQTQLNTCDRYLDDNYLYNLNPDVKFKYTQFFKNELGDPDSVITDVDYGDASCTTRKLDTASNAKDKIEGPTYSPNPGYTGVTNIAYSRLKNNLLLNQNPGLDNYTADMKFRYDKIYNTTCYWDNQSTYYTLVPSGASDTVQLTDNYTVHDRVYKVLLTSYDGVYETYWELENLGHEGRLQQYFDNPTDTLKNKNNGENVNANTCSGLSESDADMLGLSSTFTCTFKVTHKAITTGRCNPDSGHDITLNGNSCDDKAEGYQLFYFKVADPSNLFPDGNGEYGKNWSSDMINKVQSTDTYNPANETYKFVLTQGDMKLIKEYNDSRESEGGYSDFDFSCTCTDACINCKSKFLEDYYSGTFYSGSGTFTPAGKKLNEIREKYGW